MRSPTTPNLFLRSMQKIYHPLGFSKTYNFLLFFIFGGALLGFCLARASYLNIHTFLQNAAPGETYWYRQKLYKIGVQLHLISIIPAGLLAILQFLPVIRHKLLTLHRLNGYIVIVLLLLGSIGALMIARHAFGGTLSTQSGIGTLALASTFSAVKAYIHIKNLQIAHHRAWILRCWFYAGSIITLRIIMIISVVIISKIGSYYMAMPCRQIADSGGEVGRYVACREDPEGYAAVHADFGNPVGIEEVAAPFQLSFGMAMWLALGVHAVGVEIYLRLTTAETERLRQVSYERQLERVLRNSGSADLIGQSPHVNGVRMNCENEVSKPKKVLERS